MLSPFVNPRPCCEMLRGYLAAPILFSCRPKPSMLNSISSPGRKTTGGEEAVKLFSRLEGIFLDYVYTGKAAAGMIDYCRSGKIAPDETVVFLHTGGNIELFE